MNIRLHGIKSDGNCQKSRENRIPYERGENDLKCHRRDTTPEFKDTEEVNAWTDKWIEGKQKQDKKQTDKGPAQVDQKLRIDEVLPFYEETGIGGRSK